MSTGICMCGHTDSEHIGASCSRCDCEGFTSTRNRHVCHEAEPLPLGCTVNPISSASCSRGTKSCIVDHDAPPVGWQGLREEAERLLEGLTDNGNWKAFVTDSVFGPRTNGQVMSSSDGKTWFGLAGPISNEADAELIAAAPRLIRSLLAALPASPETKK